MSASLSFLFVFCSGWIRGDDVFPIPHVQGSATPPLLTRSLRWVLSTRQLDNSNAAHQSLSLALYLYLYTYVYLSAAPTYSTYVPRALPLASPSPFPITQRSMAASLFASPLFLFLYLYLYLLRVSASVRCFCELCVENVTVSSSRDNSLPGSPLWVVCTTPRLDQVGDGIGARRMDWPPEDARAHIDDCAQYH
ncbi:hypothetical protein C8Q74DRAFT_189215 [Fomes fomentarius]|nr:hypothetical protein C8Q74DRAFT_189215 [Fomes fomentarius]